MAGSVDYWRNYFRSAKSDIFDIIEKAISVAAEDCPKELRLRRDAIAELLFSRRNTVNNVNELSYGEAEALADEIEQASQLVQQVFRIKQILQDTPYQPEQVLFDSLRKLQLMDLSVDILKSTEIGKAVNGLRKHGSKRVSHLSRALIDLWKEMVDEWVNAAKALAESTPESANPSVVDDEEEEEEEEGLPSPPMDDFFATQPTTIELSQFFDGMDDDGNPRNGGEFQQNGRKPSMENQKPTRDKSQVMKKQDTYVRPNKPSNREFGVNVEPRRNNEMNKATLQRRPQQDCMDEVAKLEATKRKLQERYQQVENAKRQRTIQVMELQDLPKQRNPHVRPARHRPNGRR